MSKSISQQIDEMRLALMREKKFSRRRVELQFRLRDLVVKQLKLETRRQRKRA